MAGSALRLPAFLLALVLYGAFSSPTPDVIGMAEYVIGGLLVAVIGLSSASHLLTHSDAPYHPAIRQSGLILLAYGASITVLNGVLHGHDFMTFVRDAIAFGFLLLPLAFMKIITERPQKFRRILLGGCIIIGTLFSVRSILNSLQIQAFVFDLPVTGELLYLANMPTVLFTALFLTGWIVQQFFSPLTYRTIALSLGGIVIIALTLMAMTLTMQRASLVCVALFAIIVIGMQVIKSPSRGIIVLVLLAAIASVLWPMIDTVIEMVIQKTTLTGFNRRFEEMSAVWDAVSRNPLTILFGLGWGATFSSPAVAGVTVSFTHSLITTLLLKCGIVGLILGGVYMYSILKIVVKILKQRTSIGLALLFPIAIDIFLYASFKSLDFGLILTLVLVFSATLSNKKDNA